MWADAFSFGSSRTRSTLVGYPLHSYLQITFRRDIKQCDYMLLQQPHSHFFTFTDKMTFRQAKVSNLTKAK
jgi:hypothetical protein